MNQSFNRRATDRVDPQNLSFLSQGGELGSLIREKDWTKTSLGSLQNWPEMLKTTLRLVLTSEHPMFIWRGPKLLQFYNDAFSKALGSERHPRALGQSGEDCWGEIWPLIGQQIESVMAGGPAIWSEKRLIPFTRNGRLDNIWWTYSFSPIQGNDDVQGYSRGWSHYIAYAISRQ